MDIKEEIIEVEDQVEETKESTKYIFGFRYCDFAPTIYRQVNSSWISNPYAAAINEILLIPQDKVHWEFIGEDQDEINDKYTVEVYSDGDNEYINERYGIYRKLRGMK